MDELRRRPDYDNGSLLLVFTPVQFIDVFLSPDIGVFSVGLCPDLIKVPKFFYCDRCDRSVLFPDRFLDIEGSRIFGSADREFHDDVPPTVILYHI